ncbi:hypothetical protein BX666DRAFT_2022861 [Dichotomocladium elegans]|nr:hypothetical protein BX666DRAFT_2022861 [Dichotomocladium elegans]
MNRSLTLARCTVVSRRYITLGGHKPNLSNMPKTGNQTEDFSDIMPHAPKWDPKDATESEANVKADHEPVQNIEELRERSTEWLKKHKSDSIEMEIE